MTKAVFMGLGYIGLPTAAIVASKGIETVGVDINPNVVDTINQGKIHIVEPDLDKLVKEVVDKGMLRAATAPVPADVFFIVVPTPFKGNHEPDITYVEAATRLILPLLREGNLFIIESTCPIGTTEKIEHLIYNEQPELKGKIYIAYCPERVLPGNVLYELEHNDRIIGGVNKDSAEKAVAFYSKFVMGTLHKTNARTAEMCKLTENSSRDVQIAFANELSLICAKAEINVWELIELANKHPRVNILQPGCGVGGHCIAVDPYFLTAAFPVESQLIAKSREINNYKPLWCAEKIKNAMLEYELKHAKKPVVALLGLAFKPNIDDLRESPAKQIVQNVMQSEPENLLVVEPNISTHPIFKLTDYNKAYKQANIAAFLVAHNEFKTLQWDDDKIILDFCGIFKR